MTLPPQTLREVSRGKINTVLGHTLNDVILTDTARGKQGGNKYCVGSHP